MSSVVWNFFKKIDKQNVTCNLCGKTYKSSGNTTNLSTHLKTKHHHAFLQLKDKPKPSGRQRQVIGTSSPVASTSSATVHAPDDLAETDSMSMETSDSASGYDIGVSIFVLNVMKFIR